MDLINQHNKITKYGINNNKSIPETNQVHEDKEWSPTDE
jgi:hypothetical protein